MRLIYRLYTPINFSINHNAKKSKVSHLLQFHGPKSDPGFDGMWQPLESATDSAIFMSFFITSKTHDIARHMTSQNFLLFGVTNRNDRPSRCSTPSSKIVPCRIFYYLESVSSRNLLWPEINRTMQSFYLTLYTTSTPYTQFLDRTIFQGTKTVWRQ